MEETKIKTKNNTCSKETHIKIVNWSDCFPKESEINIKKNIVLVDWF